LEADVKLLTNPLFSRAVVVFLCSAAAFVIGAVCMRLLKRGILESGEMPAGSTGQESLPLQAYTVIQELKQQKFALQNEQQQQRRRTKTSEHITAAIIANLPVGMLFIAPNGLVRQANAAARRILGFESLTGMSAAEIFRATKVFSHGGDEIKITDALDKTLRGDPQDEGLEGWYVTPRGEQRSLAVTLIPVRVPGGEILGLACVIADQAEAAALRQAQVMRAEESAELALELRTSLSTISEWAEQMKGLGDGRVRGLSEDISAEARRLEKVIGHFLTGNGQAKGAHA
jgi:PAS domain S-box-containing protein